MPVICMFHGIFIRMYTFDTQHHQTPHIHARHAEYEASISIADGEVLAGELPRRALRLVQAWVELRRDEPGPNWALATSGRKPFNLQPL